MKYPKKADLEKGQNAVIAFLTGTCKAVVAPDIGMGRPRFLFHTKAGILTVTLFFEPRSTPWIACRFEDVKAACKHFGITLGRGMPNTRLNPHSGKWNFQSTYAPDELVELFKAEVTPLLP
jgi:hypothetical protein